MKRYFLILVTLLLLGVIGIFLLGSSCSSSSSGVHLENENSSPCSTSQNDSNACQEYKANRNLKVTPNVGNTK